MSGRLHVLAAAAAAATAAHASWPLRPAQQLLLLPFRISFFSPLSSPSLCSIDTHQPAAPRAGLMLVSLGCNSSVQCSGAAAASGASACAPIDQGTPRLSSLAVRAHYGQLLLLWLPAKSCPKGAAYRPPAVTNPSARETGVRHWRGGTGQRTCCRRLAFALVDTGDCHTAGTETCRLYGAWRPST